MIKSLSGILAAVWIISLFFAPFANAEKPDVFVSIVPQQYFVEKIAGEQVRVHVMVPPGGSPHTYEPKPGQMRTLAGAVAYFSIGVTFEDAWLDKIRSASPDMKMIHTDRGIKKREINEGHGHGHGHGHADPHIWLSPPLVMLQARNILEGLIMIDPDNRKEYQANYQTFIREIAELDVFLQNRLTPGTRFMVYHPSWGYFADAYGLIQIPIEVEGKAPKARQMQEVIRHAREKNIDSILVQPQFSTRDAETIAREIDGKTMIADPLASNWAENLKAVTELLGTR